MQDKNEYSINDLPVELAQQIVGNLKPKQVINFALASKQTLFNVQKILKLNKAQHLSTNVAYGKQNEVQNLLSKSSNTQDLLLTPASFTDYSGRTFHCTAYEYAYWAKDTHMCRMLEKQMDADTKITMLKRCEVIEKNGLTYKQHGVKIKGSKHFDFTPLKIALDIYVQGYFEWYKMNSSAALMKAAWMEVGRVQRDLPVHVINEYCRPDRSFKPTPKFDEDDLPRSLKYYDYRSGEVKNIFPLLISDSSGLGVDFALNRCQTAGCNREDRPAVWWVEDDLAAVIHLDEVRTADLAQSRENLRSSEPEQSRDMSY